MSARNDAARTIDNTPTAPNTASGESAARAAMALVAADQEKRDSELAKPTHVIRTLGQSLREYKKESLLTPATVAVALPAVHRVICQRQRRRGIRSAPIQWLLC